MSSDGNLPALSGGTEKKRGRGRPKGSTKGRGTSVTKRAVADLFKYSEAKHGATPGQQMLDLAIITPKEVRQGRALATALALKQGIDPKAFLKNFTADELGLRAKVYKHEALYGLTAKDALAFVYKRQSDLIGMTNQSQSKASEPDDDSAPGHAVTYDSALFENVEENQQFDLNLDAVVTDEVSQDDEEA